MYHYLFFDCPRFFFLTNDCSFCAEQLSNNILSLYVSDFFSMNKLYRIYRLRYKRLRLPARFIADHPLCYSIHFNNFRQLNQNERFIGSNISDALSRLSKAAPFDGERCSSYRKRASTAVSTKSASYRSLLGIR